MSKRKRRGPMPSVLFLMGGKGEQRRGERWWILDPAGHAELIAGGVLPEGRQFHHYVCTFCDAAIPTVNADGSVRPIPVYDTGELNATLCPRCANDIVADPGRNWNGGCCVCPPCQAARRKLTHNTDERR